MVDIGSRLKALRLQKHLTQQQLATQLGITKSMISAYETSTRYPSYEILIKLASLFGTTTDYLLGLENKRCIDTTGLSNSNLELVVSLVSALRDKL